MRKNKVGDSRLCSSIRLKVPRTEQNYILYVFKKPLLCLTECPPCFLFQSTHLCTEVLKSDVAEFLTRLQVNLLAVYTWASYVISHGLHCLTYNWVQQPPVIVIVINIHPLLSNDLHVGHLVMLGESGVWLNYKHYLQGTHSQWS